MKLEIKNINTSLNKAYLAQSPFVSEINKFKENYKTLFSSISPTDSEETLKTDINDFLKNTYFHGRFATKVNVNNIDLVILNGKNVDDKIGVIFETKALKSTEMITNTELNKKSFQELIQYFLEERVLNENVEIKHLIITNSIDWYIFNATEFERLFYQNKSFLKKYNDWASAQLVNKNKDWFYSEIAKPFIESEQENIVCTYFKLTDIETFAENSIIEFYKIFSPEHILKLRFQNDGNTLNREFYNELLHIIGLTETKDNTKKIQRIKETERNEGSLLENAINIIQIDDILSSIEKPERFGDTEEEQIFSIGLELCITWLNRILFLKLLESQLLNYNPNNQDFAFLNSNKIRDFEELRELFFEVLAVKPSQRKFSIQKRYSHIPYLNSSLFEQNALEKEFININQLKQHLKLPIYSSTVLKDELGKRISGEKSALQYLFDFLDSFNFASDNKVKIQETNKSIINSSVLGLIFEKINGYKEGAFYTPGFITMYMCSETLKKAVIQKFNTEYKWNCTTIIGVHNKLIDFDIDKAHANKTFNSLRICDPAVGSGHFLVSALNELIVIKSELGILCDNSGKKLTEIKFEVVNDELFITYNGILFEYDKKNAERQRIQETIFNEKRILIENCLFGVDINPKSVHICRLRLWIELLKNAFYTKETNYTELETLPNIDINIKCGNSLISRFTLNGEGFINGVAQKMQQATQKYKDQVIIYKGTTDKKTKQQAEKKITELKETFASIVNPNDKDYIELKKKESELGFAPMTFSQEDKVQWNMKVNRLNKEIKELSAKYEEKLKTVYGNSFEWRFEFPEILDENGKFIGFDVIIGNPPYISIKEIAEYYKNFFSKFYKTATGQFDLYTLFIERAYSLMTKDALFSMITSSTYFTNKSLDSIRKFLLNNTEIINLVNLDESIFDEANLDVGITLFKKSINSQDYNINIVPNRLAFDTNYFYQIPKSQFDKSENNIFNINILPHELELFNKLYSNSTKLESIANINRGIEYGGNSEEIIENSKTGYFPIIAGNCIEKYNIKHFTGYAKFVKNNKSVYKDFELYSLPRILIQRIRNLSLKTRIVSTYTDDIILCTNTLRVLTLTNKDYDYKYILGILNSSLINYYFRKSFLNKDIYAYQLGTIPIKTISLTKQQSIIKIIDQILKSKKTDIQKDISKLETKLNTLIYQLYELTPEEIKIIESE